MGKMKEGGKKTERKTSISNRQIMLWKIWEAGVEFTFFGLRSWVEPSTNMQINLRIEKS